jgi:hypothetical protein
LLPLLLLLLLPLLLSLPAISTAAPLLCLVSE